MTMIKLVTCFMVLCMISSIHAENIDVELLTINNAEVFHTSFKHDVTKMPDSVVFRVQSNREKAVLRLVKIPPLPTYVLNGDQYYPVNDDRQDLAAYKDDSRKAVILLTRHPESQLYNLEGHLQIGLRLIHIKPSTDGSQHILVSQETLFHRPQSEEHHRSKRSLSVYTIEVGFVADYENFYSFFGRNNNDLQLAEAEMRNYYAFIAEKMKVRYHHINEVDGTIAFDVVTSGLTIVENRADAWFTEDVKNGTLVEALTALNNTRYWTTSLPSGITLPASDHFMFFTGYNLVHAENLANAGLAFYGEVCRKNGRLSYSIVEDHRDGETSTTASHELGHCLNASHDGLVGCFDVNGFIMSGQAVLIQTAGMAQRPWQFSTCSVRDMKAYVQRSDVNCLNDKRYGTGVVTSTQKAGQYFTIQDQCKMKHGDKSTFCEFAYRTDKAKLCYLVFCTIPDDYTQCGSAIAMEYTTCDTNKWCHRGLCINANNTEPVFTNLPTTAIEIPEEAQGVIYTVDTYDPDVGDVMTFHLTWDPVSAAGFFTFNQTSQEVSVKPGLHLKSDGFPLSNFSLILSVDDGILRTLPVNIDFKIKVELTHPPVFSQSSYNKQVNEGKAGNVVIPSLMSSVTDKDNSIITFSLINSTYSHYFTVDSTTGRMVYSRDYDTDPTGLPSTLTLTIQATDDSDLSATANFILTIANLNQQPEFLNLPNSTDIPENALTGSVVFTVTARDPDSVDTLTYQFMNPKSFVNTYLTINSQSGVITINRTKDLDYETLDPKTVSISISVGNTHHTVEETLTIHVVNVNEPPYFTSKSYNVTTTTGPAGRIIVNSLVGEVQDPDLTDTIFTYSLMPDVYTHLFQIDSSNGHIVFAKDYGTNRTIYPREVILVVRATDSGGLQGEVPYLVIIALEEQGPVITNLPATVRLNENTATGAIIYNVTATDINPADTVTFRMQNFDSIFTMSPDGVVSITNGSMLNYETFERSINLQVTAFDGVLFSNVSILTVELQDVNEPPTFTQTQYNITVDEGKTGDIVVEELTTSVSDPENSTITFRLVPDSFSSYFTITSTTGRIVYSRDYDTDPTRLPSTVTLTVQAIDQTSLSTSARIQLTINNVNQPPRASNLPTSINVSEAAGSGTTLFIVQATDQDSVDTLIYSFTSDTTFITTNLNLNSQSGAITLIKEVDYDTITRKTNIVSISISDGHTTVNTSLTINIINVNEPPYFTQTSYNITTTTGPAGKIIVDNLANVVKDPDVTDTSFVYSIQNDTFSNLFAINQSTGQITFAVEYGTDVTMFPREVTLTVRVTDIGGLFGQTTYVITITPAGLAPVITNLPATIRLDENTVTGSTIYTVSSQLSDTSQDITYSIQTLDTGTQLFSIFNNGGISVINGSILDYETLPRVIRVRVTGVSGNLSSTPGVLTVNLIDVNEPPVFSVEQLSFTVDGGKAGQSVVSSLTQFVSDPDINDTVIFSLANIASGFSIDQSLGRITLSTDYPSTSPNPAVFMVIATDSGGLSSSVTVTMTIVNIMNTTTSVNEATTETTTRGQDGTTVTMTIVNIMNTTTRGQDETTLSTKTTTSGGSTQNRVPQFTNLPQTIALRSDTRAGTIIFTIGTSDPDVNDVITVKMATDAAFIFDTNRRTVSVKSGTMFISNATYSLQFTVTDGQYTKSSTLTVQIYLTGDAVTDKPTAGPTTPKDAGATVNPNDNPEGTEPLFNRPWVISAIVVVAIIVPSLTILVICIICRRRHSANKDEYSDDQSMKTLPMSFYPSYHSDRDPTPISFDNAVYYAK